MEQAPRDCRKIPKPDGDMMRSFLKDDTALVLRTDGVEVLADVPSHRANEFPPTTRVSVSLLNRPVLLAAADDI